LITLGAVAGAVVGVINGGSGLGREVGDKILSAAASINRMAETEPTQARSEAPEAAAADVAHLVFSSCLRKSGESVEGALRDLLEFHEHDATVALVDCLLDGEPQRFCAPAGRQQAADAMEIYLWSRDDAHRSSPAHGLADKIHLLDRAAEPDQPAEDLFALTWNGPQDRAIFDKLRSLVKQGYLEPGAFAFSGRAELREALRDVKPEASACANVARND
jgi:hypothetical protein